MFALIWQELLLIILAVVVGMLLGCYLRKMFGGSSGSAGVSAAQTGAAAAAQDEDAQAAKAFALAQETQAKLAAEDAKAEEASKPDATMGADQSSTDEKAADAKSEDNAEADASDDEGKDAVAAGDKEAASTKASDDTSSEESASGEEDESGPAQYLSEDDLAKEEEQMAAAIAALPKDASLEDKANAAGRRPTTLLDAPRNGAADDLKQIKGVGKVIEGKLNGLGIYHFDQVANLSRKEINWVTTFLSFKGRIDRENWLDQARILADGGETEFSKRATKTKLYD